MRPVFLLLLAQVQLELQLGIAGTGAFTDESGGEPKRVVLPRLLHDAPAGDSLGAGLASKLTSLLFDSLHALTRGWLVGLAVLGPSLVYGWLYQRTRDLPLIILLHALSNLVFVMFLGCYFTLLA